MINVASAIKERYPGHGMVYLKPRVLDICIVMVLEGVTGPELNDFARLVYSEEQVIDMLLEQLHWPYNKVGNFLFAAREKSNLCVRAPVILDEKEMNDMIKNWRENQDG